MIDSHTHISFDIFADDFNEVIARAKENNIEKIILVCITANDFARCLELATKFPQIFIAFGMHPGNIKDTQGDNNFLNLIETEINAQTIVAVGEIGLDYY